MLLPIAMSENKTTLMTQNAEKSSPRFLLTNGSHFHRRPLSFMKILTSTQWLNGPKINKSYGSSARTMPLSAYYPPASSNSKFNRIPQLAARHHKRRYYPERQRRQCFHYIFSLLSTLLSNQYLKQFPKKEQEILPVRPKHCSFQYVFW